MKRYYLSVFAVLLCLLVLSGCGGAKPDETTAPVQSPENQATTQAPTTEPTEPEPVYELRTVYLCVEEYLRNNEGGSSRRGYTYDEYGRKLTSFKIDSDGSHIWIQEYIYDDNGNNIEIRSDTSSEVMTYDEAGRLLSKVTYYGEELGNEYYYEYDDQGFVISETRIQRYSSETTYTFSMTYNADHTEVKIDQFMNGEPNGTTVETYNEAGQVLSSHACDNNGNWKHGWTWEYDDAGKIIKEWKYSSSETQADYPVIYTYDENGLLISKVADYYYGSSTEYTYEPFEILVRVN